nr:hypothetical protein [Tanacetum cinerariifolium]
MMTSDQFFRLENDNPHDHIRWFNKITSTIKYKDVPNSQIKLMLFPFSLTGATLRWLENEPPRSILTCDANSSSSSSEIAKLTHAVNQQTSACLVADGNTFPELRDNIQGYLSAAAVNYNQGPLPSNTIANPKDELKSITTRSGLVLYGPFVPMPPPFINPEEDERVEETLTDPNLAEFTIKVPPPLIQKRKPPSQRNFVVHQKDPLHLNIPYSLRKMKSKFITVILKKLPEKLGDPRKFLILCAFSELMCNALANLGASINYIQLLVWKKLGLSELIFTHMTLELANREICTPAKIARDVLVLVRKCTFLVDFVIVDYESDPRVPLILGRPLLRTTRGLIDVHEEETILRDGDNVLIKKLLNLDSTKEFPPPHNINPSSCSTTSSSSSSNHLLEEFADELALITFPPGNDDLLFDIEYDLREIEYLLNHDPNKELDSILEDSIYESNLADPNVNLFDTIPEMFTDEHALDYSSLPLYDEYEDDLLNLI